MPYIKPDERERFNPHIGQIIRCLTYNRKWNAGELNYVLSSIVWELFKQNKKYQTANDIMGVLECVKQEFYRRQVGPYENDKVTQNGDI